MTDEQPHHSSTPPVTEGVETPVRTRRRPALLPLDVARGFGIGLAELVPGVSGGTVALVTGVYEELIDSASHVLGAVRQVVTGPDRLSGAATELRRTDWRLIVPVLLGMVAAVIGAAGLMSGFVENHPEHARGLFGGMVAVSVLVPLRMLPADRRPRLLDGVLVAVAAVAAFLLVGLAGGGNVSDPPAVAVFAAAAVAICALVLPGVSGSYFLLAVGLYATTLGAVDEGNLAYIAVFAAGAITGLAAFVPVMRWLLTRHRRPTLLVMAGLLLGSLRALWPWQGGPDAAEGTGSLVAPYDPITGPLLLALLGATLVAVLIVVETRMNVLARKGNG